MPTESQLRDTALRLRVRHLIDNAQLPVMLPGQISAGYGSGTYAMRAIDRSPAHRSNTRSKTTFWRQAELF
jgi:hypothetical protein